MHDSGNTGDTAPQVTSEPTPPYPARASSPRASSGT